MRILVLSDIHANLNAFEAVLNSAGNVDAIWCLGDIVGYGPDPNECIDLIRSLPNLICLLGNHDAAALGYLDLYTFNREARISTEWTIDVLTDENIQFLINLPEMQIINNTTLVHGSPRNPVWEYLLDTRTATINFDLFKTQYCFVGHTHLPIVFYLDNESNTVKQKFFRTDERFQTEARAIFNPGSVGQPRDHDPRASFAIFDPEENTWQPHRVGYNITDVQNRIDNIGLPRYHAIRLAQGW